MMVPAPVLRKHTPLSAAIREAVATHHPVHQTNDPTSLRPVLTVRSHTAPELRQLRSRCVGISRQQRCYIPLRKCGVSHHSDSCTRKSVIMAVHATFLHGLRKRCRREKAVARSSVGRGARSSHWQSWHCQFPIAFMPGALAVRPQVDSSARQGIEGYPSARQTGLSSWIC